jgi:hypothetical protein
MDSLILPIIIGGILIGIGIWKSRKIWKEYRSYVKTWYSEQRPIGSTQALLSSKHLIEPLTSELPPDESEAARRKYRNAVVITNHEAGKRLKLLKNEKRYTIALQIVYSFHIILGIAVILINLFKGG